MSFEHIPTNITDRSRLCERICDGLTDGQLSKLLQLGGLSAMVLTLDKLKREVVLVRFQVDQALELYDKQMQPELQQVLAGSQGVRKSGSRKKDRRRPQR